jgi:hypothetical protein
MGDVVPPSRSQNQSRASNRGQIQGGPNPPANGQMSISQHPQPAQGTFRPQNDPNAEPIDPTAETMLKVGNSVYKVDPTNDPQQQQGSSRANVSPAQNGSIGAAEDPLLKTMVELNAASSEAGGRRNSTSRHNPSDSRGQNTALRKNTTQGGTSLSPPSSSKNLATPNNATSRDYRNSAEFVVGSYPGSQSPNAPTAALMQPPTQTTVPPPLANQPVEAVVADYNRSFPGEPKSISRSNSQQGGAPNLAANQNQGQNLSRPPGQEGHPGIGAYGQNGGRSRSTSPAPQAGPGPNRRHSQISPATSLSAGVNRGGSIANRTGTNSVGIALDPSGKVINDTMADRYNRQQQPQYNQPPGAQTNLNRMNSYSIPNNNIPSQQRPAYGGVPPPPAVYQPPPGQQPQPYAPPAAAPVQQPFNSQTGYNQPPPSHYPPPPPQQQSYQPQPSGYPGPGMNGAQVSRGPSLTGSYSNHLVSPPAHPYGTGGRTPSPQPQGPHQMPPTGQFTEDGRGVLFYGEYPDSVTY